MKGYSVKVWGGEGEGMSDHFSPLAPCSICGCVLNLQTVCIHMIGYILLRIVPKAKLCSTLQYSGYLGRYSIEEIRNSGIE